MSLLVFEKKKKQEHKTHKDSLDIQLSSTGPLKSYHIVHTFLNQQE